MKRWLRRLMQVFIALAVLAALGLLTLAALLPGLVRDRLDSQLADLGVRRASYDLPRLTVSRVQMSNVRMGESPWLTAREIDLSYSAKRLLQGRLEKIAITGAEYRVRIRDGAIDFGPEPTMSGQGGVFDLPLEQIELRDSVLVIENGKREWRVPIDAKLSRLAAGEFELHLTSVIDQEIDVAGVQVSAGGVELNLALNFSRSQVQVHAKEKTRIWLTQVMAGASQPQFAARGIDLTIEDFQNQPLVRAAWGDAHRGAWIQASIGGHQPIEFDWAGVQGRLGALSVDGSLNGPDFANWSLNAMVRTMNSAVRIAAADLSIEGISIAAPAATGADSGQAGAFTFDSLHWRGKQWTGGAGTVAMADQSLSATLQWPITEGGLVHGTAVLKRGSGGIEGEVRANLPLFDATGTELAGKVLPFLEHAVVRGNAAASFHMPIHGGGVSPELTIVAERAGLSHPDWAGSLESFSGALTLTSFKPLQSAPQQRLTIHRALVGEKEIIDGAFEYTIESDRSIAVQRALWNMHEFGRFSAAPFRFDQTHVSIATKVKAEDVGLGPWLNVLSDGRIRGEGRLQGEMEVVFEPQAQQFIRFGAGFLFAGDAPGWIQTQDNETVQRILEQSDSALSGDQRLTQVKNRIVAALQDYEYSLLRFHFIPESDGLLCRVETRGRGRGVDGQEIESLTINLHGFDAALRAALLGKSLWDLMD